MTKYLLKKYLKYLLYFEGKVRIITSRDLKWKKHTAQIPCDTKLYFLMEGGKQTVAAKPKKAYDCHAARLAIG